MTPDGADADADAVGAAGVQWSGVPSGQVNVAGRDSSGERRLDGTHLH